MGRSVLQIGNRKCFVAVLVFIVGRGDPRFEEDLLSVRTCDRQCLHWTDSYSGCRSCLFKNVSSTSTVLSFKDSKFELRNSRHRDQWLLWQESPPAVKLKAFAFHSHAGVTEAFIDLHAPFLNFSTYNLSMKHVLTVCHSRPPFVTTCSWSSITLIKLMLVWFLNTSHGG